jgi:16S rRNA processing protein RimM
MSTLLIGMIRRPHGIHGSLKVESYSGESRHFRDLEVVELVSAGQSREARIRSVEVHNGIPVLTFHGVDTPEAARKLTGWEIRVPRNSAAPLGEDEFYANELVGLTVQTDGSTRGRVVAVIEGSQAPLLEITLTTDGGTPSGTVLVPFMNEYVGTVDLKAGQLEIRTPWILDSE